MLHVKQSKAFILQSEYAGATPAISNPASKNAPTPGDKKSSSGKHASGVLDERDVLLTISLPPPAHMSLPSIKQSHFPFHVVFSTYSCPFFFQRETSSLCLLRFSYTAVFCLVLPFLHFLGMKLTSKCFAGFL